VVFFFFFLIFSLICMVERDVCFFCAASDRGFGFLVFWWLCSARFSLASPFSFLFLSFLGRLAPSILMANLLFFLSSRETGYFVSSGRFSLFTFFSLWVLFFLLSSGTGLEWAGLGWDGMGRVWEANCIPVQRSEHLCFSCF